MKPVISALIAGLLFAAGLGISGMANPAKVLGFLDVAGAWDPSLMFVMVGALAVYAPSSRLIRRRAAPLFAPFFAPLAKTRVDPPLIIGSSLFGIGWGLSGYCPGPALTNVTTGASEVLLFVGAMIVGFVAHDRVTRDTRTPSATQAAR